MAETAAAVERTFADNLGLAGQMTLQGLGIVFLVLAILWGAMTLFKLLLHDLPAKRKAAQKKTEAEVEATEPEAVPAQAETDPGELIAVISAAVAACRAEAGESDPAGFRVVSFKKTHR